MALLDDLKSRIQKSKGIFKTLMSSTLKASTTGAVSPKTVKDLGVDILQAGPRAGARVGLSVTQNRGFTPRGKFQTSVLGKEPVTSFKEGISQGDRTLQKFGVSPKVSKGLATVGVVGFTIDDLIPGAGPTDIVKGIGKKAFKKAGKEVGEEVVEKAVKNIGEATVEEVNKLKAVADGVMDEGEVLLHGTSKKGFENINKNGFVVTKGGMNRGSGISLTNDPEVSAIFGKNGGVVEVILSKDAKLLDSEDFMDLKNAIGEKEGWEGASQKAMEYFKRQGYDGIDYRKGSSVIPADALPSEVRIWNPDVIKVRRSGVTGAVENATKPVLKTFDDVAGDINLVKPEQVSSIASSMNAEKKLLDILTGAKPLLKEQAAKRSETLAQRVAAAEAVTLPGEAGLRAQKEALKGSLPKVDFPAAKNALEQEEVNSIFATINDSGKLQLLEKIRAKEGLVKVLEGKLPQKSELELMRKALSPELVAAIEGNKSNLKKVLENVADVVNIPRSIMSSFDFSGPGRQGIVLGFAQPKEFASAFKDMFKYAFNPKAYDGMLDDIAKRPTYGLMIDNKLALTDVAGDISKKEEAFISNIAGKIPGVKGSERAYSGFLTKFRADSFDAIIRDAEKAGFDVAENPEMVRQVAKFINAATGRGEIGIKSIQDALPALNSLLFSPRLIASRLNLMDPRLYTTSHPVVRKKAIKAMLGFLGTGATILSLSKAAGADVETNPTSSDFGKIRIGNTRYDPWAGFQQYIVLVSRLIANQSTSASTGKITKFGEGYKPSTRLSTLGNFASNKLSPPAAFIADYLRGKDFKGEPFNLTDAVVDRFTPMLLGDIAEVLKTDGIEGLPKVVPGVFGVGTQTFEVAPKSSVTTTRKSKPKFKKPRAL